MSWPSDPVPANTRVVWAGVSVDPLLRWERMAPRFYWVVGDCNSRPNLDTYQS